jgi:hypothetical protein
MTFKNKMPRPIEYIKANLASYEEEKDNIDALTPIDYASKLC